MRYFLTPDEMRLADNTAIKLLGIPSSILMENAAHSAYRIINMNLSNHGCGKGNIKSILIFCGSGNNGGDGFALARHLSNSYIVTVAWIGSKDKMSAETLMNLNIIENMNLKIIHIVDSQTLYDMNMEYDCIIDSLIGVGGSENLKGIVKDILGRINSSSAFKIAIDAPSGLNCQTGKAHSATFQANLTVTMFAPKCGMFLQQGLTYCGSIEIADLGAPNSLVERIAKNLILEQSDIDRIIPKRLPISSKFDYGRVLIIAGSASMPGAAALASNAAMRSGAGLVYLCTPRAHQQILPEVIVHILPANSDASLNNESFDLISHIAQKCDAIAIGPGLGTDIAASQLVEAIVNKFMNDKRLVLDADALRFINSSTKLNKNVVLTPHLGEFSRMTGLSINEITATLPDIVGEWANKLDCILHLKSVPSLTSDGTKTFWTIHGNAGMATAGSGDVLTGMIAALAARKMNLLETAAISSYLHASAGDYYASQFSKETLTAGELINCLKNVFPET